MSKLEQIDLLATPDPRIVAAIKAMSTLGNPMQDTSRRHDMDTLASSGKLFGCARVRFATGNALLMLLLQNLPNTVESIEFDRAEMDAAAGKLYPELAPKVRRAEACTSQTTALVVDIMDIAEHAEAIQTELRSGVVRELWVHCSLLSFARIWLDHAGKDAFEQFPFSRGFAVGELDQDQCVALANAIEACAHESSWYPSRIGAEFLDSVKLKPHAMKNLFRVVSNARADDEFILCGLSKRIGALLDQIHDAITTALPHIDMGPAPEPIQWKNKWKSDAVEAVLRIDRYFSNHPQRDLLIVMMSDNHERVIELARQAVEPRGGFGVGSTLRALIKLLGQLFQTREQVWWMRDWDASSNQTWSILTNGRCPVGTLGPKPVKPLSEYLNLYWFEGARSAERMRMRKNPPEFNPSIRPSSRRIQSLAHLNHTARKLQASQLCSLLLYRLGAQYPNETIRWLDVGCGNGNIANSVHIPEWLEDRIEIIGLDFGEGMINNANQRAARNRRYMVANALTPPDEIMGMRFHLVSTFEFLEHLIDPVELLKNYATLKPEIMVGGSPLGEPQPWLPARAHTWSFKREGYEALFKEAGMKITYSSEVRIGSYLGGHDWVTVAGAFGQGILPELPRDTVANLTRLETIEEYKGPSPITALGR
ncbi:MAG: class I SAM-dependent methyltransferase [Phycisphaerales bacterium]|nr:class I SAM-dependent methyltransferase [Phycisphaerales bacterium]